jgi:hypothetical protein
MDTAFGMPSATAFDAVSALASAGIYIVVAIAALATAPRDPRVRVFLATALAGVAPYYVTAQIWAWGFPAVVTKTMIGLVTLSLMMGSLALFHFTQVFPWRRPWIRAHSRTLWAGYVAVALLVGAAAVLTPGFDMSGIDRSASGGLGAVSAGAGVFVVLALLATVLALVFVLGVVVPFGALFSLYKSWLAAKTHGIEAAQKATLWMLISQLGGGVLTILIVPLLRLAAPAGPWVLIASALLFACAVLMPLAFAIGVWKLRVLNLDIDALPQ